MRQLLSCEYNMDTACVELYFSDGSILQIDTVGVENELEVNIYQSSALDFLIYNKPLEYAALVLGGGLSDYIRGSYDHMLQD